MDIPKNLNGVELIKFLKENKEDIIYAKKSEVKLADSVSVFPTVLSKFEHTTKADNPEERTEVKVRAIINTTNVIDSHKDVHIDGIWNKSLSENRNIKFLKEHKLQPYFNLMFFRVQNHINLLFMEGGEKRRILFFIKRSH